MEARQVVALHNEALDLLDAGAPERSLELARVCVTHAPTDPDCWFLLGLAHDALGNVDEAVDAWARCGDLEPERFGAALARLGRHADAREALQRAGRWDRKWLAEAEEEEDYALVLGA